MLLFDLLKRLPGKTITIYADFIDPFHYVGFHVVHARAAERGISLDWQGFELNPATPPEGLLLETAANSDLRPGMWASVERLARQNGLNLPEPTRIPNTRGAHALVELASRGDVKNPLIERIYQAYFMRQQDIGQAEVLIELARNFHIPADQVTAVLADPRLSERLEARRQAAQRRGFLGLPGFVYRGKNYFGALSRDAWENIFKGVTPQRQEGTRSGR